MLTLNTLKRSTNQSGVAAARPLSPERDGSGKRKKLKRTVLVVDGKEADADFVAREDTIAAIPGGTGIDVEELRAQIARLRREQEGEA